YLCIPVVFVSFFFSSRRRHTRSKRDWSSDVCSSDLLPRLIGSAVDVVAAGGPTGRIWTLGGQILAVGVVQAVLMALGWSMVSALGQRILAGMREDVIDRALDLPAQTMEATGIGDALSRVADDVDVAARAVNNLVP